MAKPKAKAWVRGGRVILDGSPGQVSRGCLWIEGDTHQPGWRFCQKPRLSGSNWCAEHDSKAFATTNRPARSAEWSKRFSKTRAG